MSGRPSIGRPEFDEPREYPGFESLRTPGGWGDPEEGDVLSFPVGERGAHQIADRTEDPVRP